MEGDRVRGKKRGPLPVPFQELLSLRLAPCKQEVRSRGTGEEWGGLLPTQLAATAFMFSRTCLQLFFPGKG